MKTNSRPNSLGKFSFTLVSLLVLTALALAACQPAATPAPTATQPAPTATPEAMMKPEVEVKDQEIKDSSVVIAKVVSDGPGWLVIHAQAEGKPGPVIGYAPVKSGENKDVVVKIDESKATETLYAMLHVDAGTVGTYEFPGADIPAAVDGQVITPSFKVTNLMVSMKPSVEVSDQEIKDSSVVIAKVVSDGPGWLVIHAQAEGKPGPVIGYAPVKSGENKDVVVKIDESKATETLYAMLHVDAGTVGTYEFPGADVPAAVDGQVITPTFKAMKASAGGYSSESEPGVTIKTATNSQLGTFLVDQDGMTLYLFTKDEPDKSNCTGSCLDAWPPLITTGEPKAGEGVDAAKLGFIVLADGRKQVTYDRMPLYYYAPDQKPGDVLGQGVGGVWFVVKP